MGSPKALLLFDGEPLIVHIVATLRRLFAEVVVVAAPGQSLPSMPVTLVRDEVEHQGPVAGICYGLRAAGGDVSFVTSCDSAFLNVDLISHLVSQIPEHDVVVPHWQGRYQPLHAVYRRSVLPLLAEQLARGELRPVYLFDRVRTRRIDEEEIRRFDPDGSSFFNMNTPEDYAEAQRRWSHARRPPAWIRMPRFSAPSSCSGRRASWRTRGRCRSGCPRARRSPRSMRRSPPSCRCWSARSSTPIGLASSTALRAT